MLEDSESDAGLIMHELRMGGVEFVAQRVETEEAFVGALMEFAPDLILSDYRLPGFDGAEGLVLVKKLAPEVPVIFVSGTIGEEHAVELLKMGAVDYVLKDRRFRLVAAVLRALREVEDHAVRRRAEEQVRKLSWAVEQSPVSMTITDTAGSIEYVNPKFEQLTGYAAQELLGKKMTVLNTGEMEPEESARIWETISGGHTWQGELSNRRKNGQSFWAFATISPIRDARGEITHFLVTKEDITERKKLEAQFLRAQRMETLGTLAGGIAHDLNNILTPIVMCAPMLRNALQSPREQRMIATIEASAQRGADIVKQILTFSRGVQGKREALVLSSLIKEMVRMAAETFPKNIRIETVLAPHLPKVTADVTQLHQVLLNLCVNARDAMPEGGTLRICASGHAELDARIRAEARPGEYVVMEVSDTGSGIPAEIIGKIFEPFFTTKTLGAGEEKPGGPGITGFGGMKGKGGMGTRPGAGGGGTGLGLSTTAAIIRSHDGFISVSSNVGRGTSFKVFLPAAAEPGSGVPPLSAKGAGRGGGELILIIDDDASIQTMARAVIENHGYHAVTAADCAEGLALYERHRAEIVAVVTDVGPSFPGGVSLVRNLFAHDSTLRIVACTGQSDASFMAELSLVPVSAVLPKPYTADALLTTLATLLRPAPVPGTPGAPPPFPERAL